MVTLEIELDCQYFDSGCFGYSWTYGTIVLFSNSAVVWCDKHSKPNGHVLLDKIMPHVYIGQKCYNLPVTPPKLGRFQSAENLVAIARDETGSQFEWFLFNSKANVELWVWKMVNTLSKESLGKFKSPEAYYSFLLNCPNDGNNENQAILPKSDQKLIAKNSPYKLLCDKLDNDFFESDLEDYEEDVFD